MEKKKIIIFGATGNTGAYLVDYLYNSNLCEEYDIVAVGRRKSNFFDRYKIEYFSVDISKEEEFGKLPQKNVYAVVNLAGALPAYMKTYSPRAYLDINLIGGFNVLEYCRKVEADRILYSQSIADVAGYINQSAMVNPVEIKPNMPRSIVMNNDHTVYAITKCAVVDIMENYNKMYGLKTFVLRFPNIYLYSNNDNFYIDGKEHKIAYRFLIDRATKGDDIEIWGDVNNARDIVYVKDMCQIVEKTLFVNKNSALYNVGTGVATKLVDEINGIIDVFCPSNKKSKILPCPEKKNRPGYVMNIDNLVKDLGYVPMPFIEMLKDMKKEMELKRFSELEKSFLQ